MSSRGVAYQRVMLGLVSLKNLKFLPEASQPRAGADARPANESQWRVRHSPALSYTRGANVFVLRYGNDRVAQEL